MNTKVIMYEEKNTKEMMMPMGADQQDKVIDYTEYCMNSFAQLTKSDMAKTFLSEHGIRLETASRFTVGFDPEWKNPDVLNNHEAAKGSPNLIIPIDASSYAAHNIETGVYTKVGTDGLLNVEVLHKKSRKPVFIVKEEMDVISLAEIGEEAISLGKPKNADKLLNKIKKTDLGKVFVLCAGFNGTWGAAFHKIKKELGQLNISCVWENIAENYKSLNAMLLANREDFSNTVIKAKRKINFNLYGVGNYIMLEMDKDIFDFNQNSNRKTGFENLDKLAGGIYPGLYVIGTVSSLGKTTFAHQMADKMASEGQHVLYFSFEQEPMELVCKSIARMAAQKDMNTALTSLEARINGLEEPVLNIRREYMKLVKNYLSIIPGRTAYTVLKIQSYVQKYIDRTGVKPLVIVDYLQFIPSNPLFKGSKKDLIDEELAVLKGLSNSQHIPVFVISSVNRANYFTPIDFESFKESGGIEYTADVLWGLQFSALNEELFESEKYINKKRNRIREAKNENPRKIDLVCLKNRYGISNYCAKFDYYAAHDLFVPAEEEETDSQTNARNTSGKKIKHN